MGRGSGTNVDTPPRPLIVDDPEACAKDKVRETARHPDAMDIIFLQQLRIDTVIGIYDWERKIRQTVVFDIEMGADIAAAAATDSIDDTLNYKAVAKRVTAFVEQSRFGLVETLAENVAQIIRREFDVPWVRVTLNKAGAIRGALGVGVIIERGNRT